MKGDREMNALCAKDVLLHPNVDDSDLKEAALCAIEALERLIPKKVRSGEPSSVKAFDGEDKILTYRCYPCPECGKWIHDNENHKYCQWCGQALEWSDYPTEKGGEQNG